MLLTNKLVRFKSGRVYKINKHDKYLHINVDGVNKIYSFEYSFNNHLIEALNPNVQEKVMKYLSKLKQKQLKKDAKELKKIERFIKKVKYINNHRSHNKKLNEYYNTHLKYNLL